MPERSGHLIEIPEVDFATAVERVEEELRKLRLPKPPQERPGKRRLGPGVRIAAATLLVVGAFAAAGHFPPL
ncbi:hypothetical protein JNW90_34595 [Micromonospora sp. STR1s_5]|nr:hypothetical protein [Micromonospora sp. STR1s_5]